MLETLALALTVLLPALLLRRRPYGAFFVILLTTEFYYIEIGGGFARPYHFAAVVVVLLLARHLPRLLTSRVFLALLAFVAVNLCAIILSDRPERALGSFGLFAANLAVAMAAALILAAGKVDAGSFKRIVLAVTAVGVFWGLLQIAAFRVAGISLALSPLQEYQISLGFGPSFRTEANSFGKYMMLPFLMFLPDYIELRRAKGLGRIYLVFIVGILMNFTRTSIYGLAITLLFIAVWYATGGRLILLSAKAAKIATAAAVGVGLMLGGFVNVSDYAQHKLGYLLSEEEILGGESSSYRLDMMRLIVDDALSDTKKTLIGNGWAQTVYSYKGQEVRAGGGDVIAVLGYAGLIGVLAYLLYTFTAVWSAAKIARTRDSSERTRFAEGVMFALIGAFCAGQMAGVLIAPEYWLLVGVAIYLGSEVRRRAPLALGN